MLHKWRKVFRDVDTPLICPELAVTPGCHSILHVNPPYKTNDKLLFYLALRSESVCGAEDVISHAFLILRCLMFSQEDPLAPAEGAQRPFETSVTTHPIKKASYIVGQKSSFLSLSTDGGRFCHASADLSPPNTRGSHRRGDSAPGRSRRF